MPVAALQNGLLRLLIFSGCIVFIEPSPFEVTFALAALAFFITGMRLPREALPLIGLLALFNLGGALSLIPVAHDIKAVTFTAISVYLFVVTVFFAMLMLDNAQQRFAIIAKAQIAAAIVAGVAGALGYFKIAGLGPLFTQYDGTRASGMFKDPNVFGPFITVAATFLFNGILAGRSRRVLSSVAILCFLCFAVLISFSRGAWGVLALSLAMCLVVNLLTSRSWRERQRIVVVAVLGLLGLGVAGVGALSVPTISAMVQERATLLQSYDTGETGRFGNQKRSIPLLLDSPNGLGPLQFDKKFTENPHNVYIFAFSSYGWMGGLAYLALIAVTCFIGWRMVFWRTPWQHECIALWCALFPQIVQGFQIDTDHWRHFWMLMGLTWGLAIASARWLSTSRAASSVGA